MGQPESVAQPGLARKNARISEPVPVPVRLPASAADFVQESWDLTENRLAAGLPIVF